MVCCHIENQDQKALDDDSESNDESKCSDFSINDFRYWQILKKVKKYMLFNFPKRIMKTLTYTNFKLQIL